MRTVRAFFIVFYVIHGEYVIITAFYVVGSCSTQKNLKASCSCQTYRKENTINISIMIENTDLLVEDKAKSLWVLFDPDISFKHHITTLGYKLNGTVFFLKFV